MLRLPAPATSRTSGNNYFCIFSVIFAVILSVVLRDFPVIWKYTCDFDCDVAVIFL